MPKLWKKESEELLGSPEETMGFSKDKNYLNVSSIVQSFFIKKYKLNSIEQVEDVKKQLSGRKILIINAKEILDNRTISIEELKRAIDEIKTYLAETGGSIGRIGDQYLILTPNSHVKIAN